MALKISEFASVLPFVAGIPTKVSSPSAGSFTLQAGTKFIRIKGTGSITWPNAAVAEDFDTVEWRAVSGGEQLTIA